MSKRNHDNLKFTLSPTGPTTLVEGAIEMRQQILTLSRCPLTHVTLTEKSWYVLL